MRVSKEIESQVNKIAELPVLRGRLKHESYNFSENNFNPLRLDTSEKEITFIDGGSAEIISSNSLSLFFVKTASITYRENKKVKTTVKQFFVLTKTDYDKETIFVTKIFPLEKDSSPLIMKFSGDDETLKDGINNGDISKLGGAARRFLELRHAKESIENLSENSLIVLDGSLQCTLTNEQKYFNEMIETAKKNNVLVMAVSKTNNLLTDTGASVESVLLNMSKNIQSHSISKKSMWYYSPLISVSEESYNANIFMVKLHKNSKHIFKLEISKEFGHINYSKVIGCLAYNSGDPVFLGYPYGLIKADDVARVDGDDLSYVRMHFLRNIDMDELEASKNAHSILDKIRF